MCLDLVLFLFLIYYYSFDTSISMIRVDKGIFEYFRIIKNIVSVYLYLPSIYNAPGFWGSPWRQEGWEGWEYMVEDKKTKKQKGEILTVCVC